MPRAKILNAARVTMIWLLSFFLAFVFVVQGAAKFSSTSGWATAFRHWGYPVWFRQSVGVAEILAGLLLVLPATAPLGALTIIALMIGAIITHTVAGDPQKFQNELGPIVFAVAVLALRWRMRPRLPFAGSREP